jgi:3-methyladenine DNA glycosylase/8-oxoguanine DNA glycosylase
MIAIFYLGRMDVWPETDGGILRACKAVFGTDEYSQINKHIKGHETVTAVYLWELINKNLVYRFDGISHG